MKLSWDRITQVVGLLLIAAHVLLSEHPDGAVILALLGLCGLPEFINADRRRRDK